MLPYTYRHGFGKAVHRISNPGRTLFGHGGHLMALTLWKRVLACIEGVLRVLRETLGMTPQQLMTTICDNDREKVKILVMAEALEKWDEVCGQSA